MSYRITLKSGQFALVSNGLQLDRYIRGRDDIADIQLVTKEALEHDIRYVVQFGDSPAYLSPAPKDPAAWTFDLKFAAIFPDENKAEQAIWSAKQNSSTIVDTKILPAKITIELVTE